MALPRLNAAMLKAEASTGASSACAITCICNGATVANKAAPNEAASNKPSEAAASPVESC